MIFQYGRTVETLRCSVGSDGKYVKKYHTQFLAGCDEELTRDEVLALIGILPGAAHWEWMWATCNDISCERIMSREPCCWWHVDYDHSTDATVPSDSGDTAPELRRVLRSTGNVEQQIFIIKDEDGNLITDAAGTPFDGGVPVTDFLGSIDWERDETHTSSSMSQANLLTGYTNNDTFMGCAPGTLLLKVTGKEKYEGAYHFWTFSYNMTYDRNGHQPKPANAGLWEIVTGSRVRILEGDGTPTEQPQPLTTGGVQIPYAYRPALCNYVTVKHHPRMAFSSLGLPTT